MKTSSGNDIFPDKRQEIKNKMVKKLSTKQILEENIDRKPPEKLARVKILLHNIRSMHNVGSVFRSSDAFGISEILISGYTPAPPRDEISKTAIGAEEFMEWSYWENEEKLFKHLKEKGYTIAGLEQTDQSIPLPEFTPDTYDKICIVLGNEVTGIDEKVIPFIDEFISIPQFGHKHSLNVSVAAGVTLYALLEKLWK